ncbi:hypothetical protein HH303_15775 [Rhodospirillaceae bacterium KN72]|uniref:Uncharacterized protein n=1 Tax=Pacificispira spongiicola TaxID=2729598 RepID=A0A7Y0E2C1_9PROT|nr:hypothetical protein [Pacificispira spongiicola]NMM45957.1 hypothetical protein [Pacificispira spongiicola]
MPSDDQKKDTEVRRKSNDRIVETQEQLYAFDKNPLRLASAYRAARENGDDLPPYVFDWLDAAMGELDRLHKSAYWGANGIGAAEVAKAFGFTNFGKVFREGNTYDPEYLAVLYRHFKKQNIEKWGRDVKDHTAQDVADFMGISKSTVNRAIKEYEKWEQFQEGS